MVFYKEVSKSYFLKIVSGFLLEDGSGRIRKPKKGGCLSDLYAHRILEISSSYMRIFFLLWAKSI